MNTYSAMTIATQRQAEDQSRARRHALASEARHPGRGYRFAGCSVSAGRHSLAP
jgi:hypothetical protein